jgi:hypothetical protein
MKTPHRTHSNLRALGQLALLWAIALAAASTWAAGLPDDMPEDRATCPGDFMASAGAAQGWWRLALGDHAVDVHAMARGTVSDREPDGSMYARIPGARLKEGARRQYRYLDKVAQPKTGKDYQLTFGKTPFSFAVASDANGTQLSVGYGGQMHDYLLGLPAAQTRIAGIADLDGDGMPDFIVDVGDDTYLLLSSQAHPGANRPSAQLFGCGC